MKKEELLQLTGYLCVGPYLSLHPQALEWCGRAVLPGTVADVGSVVQFLPFGCVLSRDLYALVESLPGIPEPTKHGSFEIFKHQSLNRVFKYKKTLCLLNQIPQVLKH